jgi:hypothetical protein
MASMPRSIDLCGAVAASAVALVLASCGGSGPSRNSSSPSRSSSTPGRTSASETTTSKRSAPGAPAPTGSSGDTQVVDLPGLGSLSYRCDGSGRRVRATLGGTVLATEGVTVERDSGGHLLRGQLGLPGHSRITVPFAAYRSLIWRVIQSTEALTVEATVKLDFSTGVGRSTAPGNCALTRWSSTVNVIRHDGKWSLPPSWA